MLGSRMFCAFSGSLQIDRLGVKHVLWQILESCSLFAEETAAMLGFGMKT